MEPSCARPGNTLGPYSYSYFYHLPNGPRIRRGPFREWALPTPEAVERMDILPGLGHSQNNIGALVRPYPMIVEMGGNRSPGRFGRGETPSSNKHGPLIRWPVQGRRARCTFLPPHILYPHP
jgi:hypothetical protein